ncbi:MAG: hypothetical protein CVV28_07095 [Methanobacteriales archaeon HGW-Methanobacteriales-1]|jgi:uncharacterized membrane-anchored protein YitT (DUF2179 family)|nr:MAG: hypothetical protein CVV28_07095 [Methanobacteriales archaeon HGW-Methanobacteriales-1]
MKEKKYSSNLEKEMKLSSKMNKQLSPTRAVLRLMAGFFALLIWLFLGVPPTLIYSSGIQSFIGTFSFFIRNPIIFLLIAFLNIILGTLEFIFLGVLWWSAFHWIWSIRWFYGYGKYRNLKNPDELIKNQLNKLN